MGGTGAHDANFAVFAGRVALPPKEPAAWSEVGSREKVEKSFSVAGLHFEYVLFRTTRQGVIGKRMKENEKAPYFTHF